MHKCVTQPQWYNPGFQESNADITNVDPVFIYHKTFNIRCTLVGNEIVDHTDVVGALPVGAAPTTSSFSAWHLASRDSAKKTTRQYENL